MFKKEGSGYLNAKTNAQFNVRAYPITTSEIKTESSEKNITNF